MLDRCLLVGMFLGVMIGGMAVMFAFSKRGEQGIYIPCDIAEISPDIPPAAKEECRRRKKNAMSALQ